MNIRLKREKKMEVTFEDYQKAMDKNRETVLNEQELREKYDTEKAQHEYSVNKLAGKYEKLDMDMFVERIGGYKKIEEMRKINDIADKRDKEQMEYRKRLSPLLKGQDNHEQHLNEAIEEWKRGFMEGFEEAYKRFGAQ